jgi:hypothetical protein
MLIGHAFWVGILHSVARKQKCPGGASAASTPS